VVGVFPPVPQSRNNLSMVKNIRALTSLGLSLGLVPAASFPSAEIMNDQIRARIYLPDLKNGYYRGTRFDWSGVVYSLRYRGHDYYGPWFNKTDPTVHDFVYRGPDIVAGPCSAITGPVDEFGPIGWDDARAGGNFIKIGVGALRRPHEGKYDNYTLYEIASPGNWTIRRNPDSIEFIHELADSSSGYAYIYRKIVRLTTRQPEMVLEHSLKNTGTHAIQTSVYNHNFLVLNEQAPGPGFVITVPFAIQTRRPPNKRLAEIRGNQIVYLNTLENRDVVATSLQGFSDRPEDHDIRIENKKRGVGMRITADRPLSSESLWSIRTVIAMEPFISMTVEPGDEFTWKSTYDYYTLPADESK
jgi:hypothetical protein